MAQASRKESASNAPKLERSASARIKNVFRTQRSSSSPESSNTSLAGTEEGQFGDVRSMSHSNASQTRKMGHRVSIRGGPEAADVSERTDVSLNERPEWKGASGRTKLVAPVVDKPLPPGERLVVPHRVQRKASPLSSVQYGAGSPSTTTPVTPVKMSTTPLPLQSNPTSSSEISNSPYLVTSSPATPDPFSADNYQNMPTPDTNVSGRSPVADVNSLGVELGENSAEKQPISRFSWSTHATGTTAAHPSPPPTPPPPMPALAASAAYFSTPGSKMSGPVQPFITSAPRPPRSTDTGGSLSPLSPTSASLTGRSKALPPSPLVQASGDLVSSLEAQLDDLRHQRRNLQRLTGDLTKASQQNPFAQDIAARRETARKLRELEAELADVTNQEHDTGLRLHRAWKRRDKDGDQHTSIWVRRVTG